MNISDLIKFALDEDLGLAGDITSQAIFAPDHKSSAKIIAREKGVLSGISIVEQVFGLGQVKMNDGAKVKKGDVVFEINNAPTLHILSHERVALNLLSHLSGIATATSKYVEAVKGTNTHICCTRKTIPNLRSLQKQAVKHGGGNNHRFGLFDAVMIKDNHIAACGGDILKTIEKVKNAVGHMVKIEIEVDTIEQFKKIIGSPVDVVLLDNMSPAQILEIIAINNNRYILEASGGITIETIGDYAKTGVNLISVGALTHSVKAFDFGLDYL
ncbi:MAG: nicotinate-nucleotide diphosphorylase (carboxylating) [Micavibrio sp.]|nr:nicotinate-nucleotide diphosphorylase (carboxylating) [Micavibrio sp.]|tara:strand:+ start:959 stop:1771 length:813 start_codon:yes stop_codon:yes gene_type:complete